MDAEDNTKLAPEWKNSALVVRPPRAYLTGDWLTRGVGLRSGPGFILVHRHVGGAMLRRMVTAGGPAPR